MGRSDKAKWLIVVPAMLGIVFVTCGTYNGYLGIWCIYLPADCNFGIGLWSTNRDAGTEQKEGLSVSTGGTA